MKTITCKQFVEDYNKHFNTDYRIITTNTLEIDNIVEKIYGCVDFEFDEDMENITLY